MRRERQTGQAGVELVAVVLGLALLSLAGWQVLVAAHAWQSAHTAARVAARAGQVGAPAERAARAVLPDRLARRAAVTVRLTPRAFAVRVRVRVPVVVPFVGDMGAVEAAVRVAR